MIGGATLDGPRHVWWNFVSSRKERIEQAKNEWREGKFAGVPGDEIEFIPLPENRPYTAGWLGVRGGYARQAIKGLRQAAQRHTGPIDGPEPTVLV